MSIDHGDSGARHPVWGGDPASLPPEAVPSGAAARSPAGAALLNLTGLALGYAYLRRWGRAALHLAGSLVLVAVAFATNAASLPWVWGPLAVAWLAWMAFDGWQVAQHDRRVYRHGWQVAQHGRPVAQHGRPVARHGYRSPSARHQLVPVVTGTVLVAAVVVGYLLYGAAGRSLYAKGVAAQSRGDCTSAVRKFDTVTRWYELTLSRDVVAAAQARQQCVAFLAASQAEQYGAYAEAAELYQDFRREYPATVLAPFAQENLQRTYTTWASSLRHIGDYPAAISVYRQLLAESAAGPDAEQVRGHLAATHFEQAAAIRAELPASIGEQRVEQTRTAVEVLLVIQQEFADTAPAPLVPQALVDTYLAANNLFTEQRFCPALPVLDFFVTVPEFAGLAGTAHANRTTALLECGLERYRAGDYAVTLRELGKLIEAYPGSPLAPQARSVMISAQVAAEKRGGPPPVLPAPLGGNSPGSIEYTLYNDNPLEVRVLIAGPTAHEITLPGCPDCPPNYLSQAEGCPSLRGKPSATLRLRPGVYDELSFYPANPEIKRDIRTHTLESGFVYTNCLFIEREGFALDPPR